MVLANLKHSHIVCSKLRVRTHHCQHYQAQEYGHTPPPVLPPLTYLVLEYGCLLVELRVSGSDL